MSGDVLVVTAGGGGRYWHLVLVDSAEVRNVVLE